MTRTVEAIFDGTVFRPNEPLQLPPNTRVRITIESPPQSEGESSFLDTAYALNLAGPSDWAANLEEYLYGGKTHPE